MPFTPGARAPRRRRLRPSPTTAAARATLRLARPPSRRPLLARHAVVRRGEGPANAGSAHARVGRRPSPGGAGARRRGPRAALTPSAFVVRLLPPAPPRLVSAASQRDAASPPPLAGVRVGDLAPNARPAGPAVAGGACAQQVRQRARERFFYARSRQPCGGRKAAARETQRPRGRGGGAASRRHLPLTAPPAPRRSLCARRTSSRSPGCGATAAACGAPPPRGVPTPGLGRVPAKHRHTASPPSLPVRFPNGPARLRAPPPAGGRAGRLAPTPEAAARPSGSSASGRWRRLRRRAAPFRRSLHLRRLHKTTPAAIVLG